MQPFSNIRVIDMTHVIAGPFSTYQLSVLGAEVIKIESPTNPDMVRFDGGDEEQAKQGMGSVFLAQNANKKSVAVDIKTERGRDIVLDLLKGADVLVENYRPGALEKLGLGYDAVKQIQPDIVYCSLTGYGQDGPMGERTAYDNVIQAISGLMASTGSDASGSMKVGPPVLDYGTGIQAAFAIAAALYQRTFTGEGQHIDIAMQDAAIMLSSTNVTYLESAGQNTPLTGNHSGSIAAYGCFDTSNGLLMLGAYTGEQVYNTWRVLGDPEHGEKLRTLKTYEMRAHLESDRARMEKIFLTADADEWEQRFNDAKVPAARVRHADETLSHDQLMHRNVVHRTLVDDREIFLPVAAFKYGSDGPTIRSAPPRHGEHTLEVLDQAGFSKENLEQLMADGVIAGL